MCEFYAFYQQPGGYSCEHGNYLFLAISTYVLQYDSDKGFHLYSWLFLRLRKSLKEGKYWYKYSSVVLLVDGFCGYTGQRTIILLAVYWLWKMQNTKDMWAFWTFWNSLQSEFNLSFVVLRVQKLELYIKVFLNRTFAWKTWFDTVSGLYFNSNIYTIL